MYSNTWAQFSTESVRTCIFLPNFVLNLAKQRIESCRRRRREEREFLHSTSSSLLSIYTFHPVESFGVNSILQQIAPLTFFCACVIVVTLFYTFFLQWVSKYFILRERSYICARGERYSGSKTRVNICAFSLCRFLLVG